MDIVCMRVVCMGLASVAIFWIIDYITQTGEFSTASGQCNHAMSLDNRNVTGKVIRIIGYKLHCLGCMEMTLLA